MLVDAVLVEIYDPLMEFLTLALVKPSATWSTPLTVQTHVWASDYVHSTAAISYRQEHILYRDLPGL
jgi:hypothetical protein